MNHMASSSGELRIGKRRHSRLGARLPARMMTTFETHSVWLYDLSFGGARVAFDGIAPPGTEFLLCWAQFEVFCKVAWCCNGYCGLEFDEPLEGKVLIATRDLNDASPRIDPNRVFARSFVKGER